MEKAKPRIILSCDLKMLDLRTIRALEEYYELKHIGCTLDEKGLLEASVGAWGIIIGGMEKITVPVLEEFLKMTENPIIIFLGIQHETFFSEEALSFCQIHKITIHHTGEGAGQVAEQTLKIILYERPLEVYMQMALSPSLRPLKEIAKRQKVAVIGAGHIGSLVIKGLVGKVKKVRYYARTQKDELDDLGAIFYGDLAECLKGVDIATIHLPLAWKTAGLITLGMIKSMNPSSFILNAARHGIISLDTLSEAARLTPRPKVLEDADILEIPEEERVKITEMMESGFLRLTGHTFALGGLVSLDRGRRLLQLIEEKKLY